MRLAFTLLTFCALAGCATAPDAVSEPPIAQGARIAGTVELCKTTLAELRTSLGQPSRDGLLGRTRVVTWIVEWDPLVKYVGVVANEAGTVVDLYWNLPSEVQWAPTDRCR
jgi:hypothetical protein